MKTLYVYLWRAGNGHPWYVNQTVFTDPEVAALVLASEKAQRPTWQHELREVELPA